MRLKSNPPIAGILFFVAMFADYIAPHRNTAYPEARLALESNPRMVSSYCFYL